MIKLPAIFYDGQTSAALPVQVDFDGHGQLHVTGEGVARHYAVVEVKSKPRVGKLPAQLIFPDQSICELGDHPELEQALHLLPQRSFQDFIHKIENNLLAILASLLLAIAVVFAIIKYGIPYGAKLVAFQIPIGVEQRMGREALALLDKTICKPSQLPAKRQLAIEQTFASALLKMQAPPITLYFRHCEKMGANALALPSGIILFTDDIIKLAKDDRELLGVLAHEVGHITQRHNMRQILQNSVTVLLLVLVTGDIGSASSFAAALPTLLVQASYSRKFEAESDSYAKLFLESQNISPAHLANLLRRLAKQEGNSESRIINFISSHPLTNDRIKKLQE